MIIIKKKPTKRLIKKLSNLIRLRKKTDLKFELLGYYFLAFLLKLWIKSQLCFYLVP